MVGSVHSPVTQSTGPVGGNGATTGSEQPKLADKVENIKNMAGAEGERVKTNASAFSSLVSFVTKTLSWVAALPGALVKAAQNKWQGKAKQSESESNMAERADKLAHLARMDIARGGELLQSRRLLETIPEEDESESDLSKQSAPPPSHGENCDSGDSIRSSSLAEEKDSKKKKDEGWVQTTPDVTI